MIRVAEQKQSSYSEYFNKRETNKDNNRANNNNMNTTNDMNTTNNNTAWWVGER